MSIVDEWDAWRAERAAAVTAPHGIAALARTAWLGDEPEPVDGLPGRWSIDTGRAIVGVGLTGLLAHPEIDELILDAPGQVHAFGDVLARRFDRDGTVALRVIDPASPNRTTIEAIEAFAFDPDWVVTGRFAPADAAATVDVVAVDGVTSRASVGGTIALPLPTGEVELTVTRNRGGELSAVFADATNGVDSYRFRFIDVPDPVDGQITVDFTRAYLPPCAFSDEYVCPTPLPGNRWPFRVEAGERLVTRSR